MTLYDYLIIGGGMTAAAAAKAIREADPKGLIGMFSAEPHLPYNRPPLTKKLWLGKSEETIWRDLPQHHLETFLNRRIISLDAPRKSIQDEFGNAYAYNKLLLATGGVPRRLEFAPEETVYFRTLDDYHTVRGWTGKGARIGVIGGGFIGSEIAAALAANGEQAVMVFPGAGIGSRIYPAGLSDFVTGYYREKGVEVHPGMEIQAVERSAGGFVLRAKDGRSTVVDHIIAGIGIRPNTQLAQAAGITVGEPHEGGGVHVDEYLRTSQPDVFAAGDAASFYNGDLARWMRVEHEDNANSMGRAAGLNMAGQMEPYHHQPYFYSDLFDLGYEAVGELDSSLETYADWREPFRKGVIYYLKEGQVRGVLLWNTWDQVDAARQIIKQGRRFDPQELKGQLPVSA